MGVVDKTVFAERVKRKLQIAAEAVSAGSMAAGTQEETGFTSLVFANGTARHFYAEGHIQGTFLEGLLTDPGEHHAILPCRIPAAAAFLIDRLGWWSPDPNLTQALQQVEQVLQLGAQEWKWYRKEGGKTFYRATWCAQLRPTADGTHLVMRGLQGEMPNLVGMRALLKLAGALQTALAQAPAGAEQPLPYPVAFEAAFQTFSGPRFTARLAPPANAESQLKEVLRKVDSKELALAPVDPKWTKLAQRATPEWAAKFPVLAVLGKEGFLLPTEVLVVTPTHGFVNYRDLRCTFAWSELLGVAEPEADHEEVYLQTAKMGMVRIPGTGQARAVAAAFRSVVSSLRG
jgi:hypothetical protein